MTLKVAVIGGAGHIGYVNKGVQELDDARLCAVASGCPDEDVDRVRERAGAGLDVKGFDDYRKMLDEIKPDVVGVAPFYYLHSEVAFETLERGIPVFCEKPLALTLDELDRVSRAQKKADVPVGMMLSFRYFPAFIKAHDLVAQGAIGTPTVGYSQKSYKRGNRPDFYKKRETFGGIIPWVGIHAIDWFRWISGTEYTAVSGFHSKLHRPDYPEMEDAATCLFELDNGGTAVMSFDFLRPTGAPTHADDRLRLLGDLGAVETVGRDKVELMTAQGVEQFDCPEPEHGQFADFALSIIDPDHICRISTEDAFRVTEISLKARDAADGRTRIEL